MEYRFDVIMFSTKTKEALRFVEAYKRKSSAESRCDTENVLNSEDPFYGKVFYDVVERR